jgi:hypothetical protein
MGTSKSSSGPGKNVGLVPPWLNVPAGSPPPQPPIPPSLPVGANPNVGQPQTPPNAPPYGPGDTPLEQRPQQAPPPPRTSVPRRFTEARRALGDFMRTGDAAARRRGLGSYVAKGYRGSANASARMGQAATSASRAYEVLSGLADGTATPADLGFNPADLAGADFEDVIDALTDSICKGDTTLDDAAGRQAVSEAISEVIGDTPGLDPLDMPPDQIREVWLRTLAYHVFSDIMRDIGGDLQHAANGDYGLFNDRSVDIRNFIRESYREQFEVIAAQGRPLNRNTCDAIGRDVNRLVLDVYQGWLE